jgi:hypothetical protein
MGSLTAPTTVSIIKDINSKLLSFLYQITTRKQKTSSKNLYQTNQQFIVAFRGGLPFA